MSADPNAYADPTGPVIEVDPARLVELMTQAVIKNREAEGFYVGACLAGPPPEGPWRPIVKVQLGGLEWFISPDTARQVADRLAACRIAFENPAAVAASFHHYAATAERLAAGDTPFTKETH